MIYPQYPDDQRESRYTDRKPFQMHPEFWHAADPDSTEFEVLELLGAFIRALQPEVVVETGSAFGFGSRYMGEALQANGHGKLYSVEFNAERIPVATERVRGLPVEIIHTDSTKWTPPDGIGFAFFDSYPETRPIEFRNFKPYMIEGAIVAFHDAAPHHQVYCHVQSLEAEGLLKPIRLHTPRGIAICEVL